MKKNATMTRNDQPELVFRRRITSNDTCCGADPGHHPHSHGPAKSPPVPNTPPPNASQVCYRIDNMDCPTEERLIRNRLESMQGIVRLDFNLLDRELTVFHRLNDAHPIARALQSLNMAPILLEVGQRALPAPPVLNRRTVTLALSGMAAVAAESLAWATGKEDWWPVIALALVCIGGTGLPILKKGWVALKNFTLNIFFLMSLAVCGAIAIGKWPEAAMVVFLFAVAETIEALSLERARHAIKSLTALAPETAEVKSSDGWRDTPLEEVCVGSHFRVRAGARVPLDAVVVGGAASLDQAPITGESMPVDKVLGDRLYAGSIVLDGVIEATSTSVSGNSTLARIATAIQNAQSQRAPTQRMVDQFARFYTPTVVGLAVLIALLGPIVMGGNWSVWGYQALVMLVIACPCALVISTPVTVVSGMAAAARRGILIKGGIFLEGGRLLKVVAFDKTGTLTAGKPALTDAIALANVPIERCLLLASSLNDHSTHPIAQALVSAWRNRSPASVLVPVSGFRVLVGRGVTGQIDGQSWHIGNHRLIEELGMCSVQLEECLAGLESQGKTAVVLCGPAGPVALFALADTMRPQSQEAVAALRALGVESIMLSGDNQKTAGAIAAQLGIRDARGNLLPEDKQAAVADLGASHGAVAMVGDGVNDAPALARADIGIAMGAAATATAMETADVAIMDDDLRKIGTFIRLSRLTTLILRENIVVALGIKVVFLGLALSGHATLWMAVFADLGASLLVVMNGTRLLRLKI